MEKNEILNKIYDIMKANLPEGYRAVIFGSTAKGSAINTSDIDVGILGKNKLDWRLMTKILEKIDEIPTLRKIDVVDLNSVSDDFRKSVLENYKNIEDLEYARNI